METGGSPTSASRVADHLRQLWYNDYKWNWMCGSKTLEKTGLTDDDITILKNMIGHKFHYKKNTETGVVLTRDGTIAFGHVIAGVDCGGYNRDTSVTAAEWFGGFTSSHLDNLFYSTISGDIGQTTLAYYSDTTEYSLFSPEGKWDNPSCPKVYKVKSKDTRMTDAEVLGDIDGFVLGTIIPKINKKWKLSRILSKYYQKDGIAVGGRMYSSANRAVRFGEIVSEKELTAQALAFAEAWHYSHESSYGDADRDFLLSKVPSVVKTFFKTYITVDEHTSTGSQFLPHYKMLVSVYPGDSAVDLLKKLTRNLRLDGVKTLAATDGLRLSYMLNHLDGHHIPKTQSQGAFIGTDKKVYVFDLAALKIYLTKTYKDPLTSQSVSMFKGQRGIMMLDVSQSDGSAGSVGLWDGKDMHQITDYTKTTTDKTVYLWQTKGCMSLADVGDCDFYKCEDNVIPCGHDGYALGYGYRYCNRFGESYDKFTDDGKLWVDAVRKCLMKAIAPFYKGAHDCDTIKRFAFDSHVNCYINSGYGVCKLANDELNLVALGAVYELKDFVGPESAAAKNQVVDTADYCIRYWTKPFHDKIPQGVKENYKKLKQLLMSDLQEKDAAAAIFNADVTSQCVAYANAGDCRFYGCFHQRFPCDVFGSSHITDFELQLCKDLDTHSAYLDSQGRRWLKASNQCLMRKLLPVYRQSSVSCIDLHNVMFRDRIDCLVDNGFCGVTDSTANRWAIDRGTVVDGYPAQLPVKSDLSTAGREYFFSELSSLRRLMGYANYACYAMGLKKHATFYARVHTVSGYKLVEQT